MKYKLIFYFLLLSIILSSCKTQYIPIETIKTEYRNSVDSIIIKDTISINQYINGDTVYKEKEVIRWREKIKKDTVIVNDTIPKIVTVEKIKYKSRWSDNLDILIFVFIVILITTLINKFKK